MSHAPPPDFTESNSSSQQPVTMNGPTEGASATSSGDKTLLWERSWTIPEIRKQADNWSLAADSGLLLYLKEFSQHMISKTHEVENEVNGLVHEAKLNGVCLHNVFNDFMMLANTQFVENRVYDEDVNQGMPSTESKPEEKEKTREQREAELIPMLTDAVKMGLDVIDKSFDVLEVNVVESESEEEGDIPIRADPILEAKDPYVLRPLPYIIGTPQFFNEDEVGLMDLPSDVEDESSHGSLSESEDEKDSEYSDSDEEPGDAKMNKYKSEIRTTSEEDSDDSEAEDDGNLFGAKASQSDKESSDDEIGEDNQDERGTTHGNAFASELASRIGAAVPKPRPVPGDSDDDDDEGSDGDQRVVEPVKKERTESRSKKSHEREKKEHGKHKTKKKHQEPEDDGELFGADADDSPFGKGGGLFSSSKGMFDDDADNEKQMGGLFDDDDRPAKREEIIEENEKVDERKRTKSGRIIPVGAVSIFGPGDDSIYAVRSPAASEDDLAEQRGSKKLHDKKVGLAKVEENKPAAASGLFDSDDDDDLFASGSTKNKATAPPKKKAEPIKKPAVDLFGGTGMDDDNHDDNDDDLFPGNTTVKNYTPVEPPKDQQPKKKLPAGAVSMFGGATNPLTAALKKQRPPSDDEAGDSDDDIKDSGSIKSTQSNLSISSSATNKLISSVKKDDGNMSTSASNSSLFAEEPEDDPFLGKAKTESKPPSQSKTQANSGLFSADDEDDLFGNSQPAKVPQGSSSTIAAPAGAMETKRQTSILFGDDNDDDAGEGLFAATTTSKASESGAAKKKPVGGVSLFGGVDLFGKDDKEKDNVQEAIKKEEPPPRKATLSLFDEDDEDDLFGSGNSTKKTVVKKPKSNAIPKETETKARSKSKRVFDDEDILFGGSLDEEAPKIDLFGSESPLKTKPDKPPSSKKPINLAKDTKTVPIRDATVTSSSTDANLFGDGDDEEEDLFGDGKKDEQKVEINDVTTSESSTDDVPKRKKLPGAVSLFGGIDPLAGRRKVEEKDEENKHAENAIHPPLSEPEKIKESRKPPPPTGRVPLFAGAAPASLPKVRSGSDIMREAERKRLENDRKLSQERKTPDTLFGSPENDNLFGKPVLSSSAEAKPIMHPKTEPKQVLHPKSEAKPVLHPKAEPKPVLHPKAEPKPVLHPKTEPKPIPHLPAEPKPVPHLPAEPKPVPERRAKPMLHPKAGAKPAPAPRSEASPETKQKPTDLGIKPGKKPPPGAVSLFGGIDPLASPTRSAKPFIKQSVSPDSDEGLFGAASDHTDSKPQGEHMTSTSTMKGKVGKLQANLAINPAALLPGASPPVVESKEIAINFDEPPAVQTLENINKDKAKLQPHKRKPSRRARHAAAENANLDFTDTTSTVSSKSTTPSATPRTSPESDATASVNKSDSSDSKSTHKVNPLRNSPQSLIPEVKRVKTKTSENEGIDSLLSLGMDRNRAAAKDDDIFKSAFTKTSDKKSNLITNDDLFSSSSVTAKTSGKNNNVTHKTGLDDDDDDLFGGPGISKSHSVATKVPTKIDNDDYLFGGGISTVSNSSKSDKKVPSKSQTDKKVPKVDDDIFSTVKTKPVIAENNDMVNDIEDADEDIFADTSMKKKGPKPSPIIAILDKAYEDDTETAIKQASVDPAKAESTPVLPNGEKESTPDETADMKGQKSKKKESRKTKKAKTKDEDLFKDETDIFADLPASKPKEKKKKKTTTTTSSSSTSAKKSVFSDNVDDIFSSTPAGSKSKKQDASKKKTSTKPARADSGDTSNIAADIFEDNSENIFNDPLSAAGK